MDQPPEVKKQYYTKLMDIYRYNPVYIPFLNSLIRFTQSSKYERDLARIKSLSPDQEIEIRKWFAEHKFFFGFGVFRSGTTFLADFLNKLINDAVIGHEVNVNDYWAYPKAIHSEVEAAEYLKEYRLNEIYFRNKAYNFRVYGEINPFLRRHCVGIKQLLPEAKFFHVVRDPKKVIRSLMSRELFGWKDPMGKLIYPSSNDPFVKEWKKWGRFEKLCWMWSADNKLLRETCGHSIKFEELRKDFEYFKLNVLDFLDLKMTQQTWEENINMVNNPTPVYRFPEYKDWSSNQIENFERICGDEMGFYGY